MEFPLPPIIIELVTARNRLREHYSTVGLDFTLDGNLVGDIGEAIAAEIFGVKLSKKNGRGIDGHVGNLSVQVKASGRGLGPAFRKVDTRADHLLFFSLDFEACKGVVTFNGPEHIALAKLPQTWTKDQRSLTLKQIRDANQLVAENDRLKPPTGYPKSS